jgi:hypothetical protein
MQHLQDVRSVSGPVSAHVFQVQTGPGRTAAVYLFGDVHFSYDNRCTRCSESKGCYGVVDFIEKAQKEAVDRGRDLDVFFELPYVPAANNMRNQALSWIDAYFTRNASVGTALESAMGKLFGRSPQYIGIFSKLYRRFGERTYHHSHGQGNQGNHGNQDNNDNDKVRFHYADARLEPNAMRLIMPMQKDLDWLVAFHQRVDSSAKLAELLAAFMFSKDFVGDVRSLYGNDAPVVDAALSTMTIDGKACRVHKIAKQFHKLPAHVKPAVTKYLKDRVARIQGFMRDVAMYDEGAKLLNGTTAAKISSSRMPSHELSMFREIMQQRSINYLGEAEFTIMFVGCTLLMDAYLLCRMMGYLCRPSATQDGCAIVYAGDAHIEHYADFFVNYLGPATAKPVLCAPLQLDEDSADESAVVRCVSMEKMSCPAKKLDAMFPASSVVKDGKKNNKKVKHVSPSTANKVPARKATQNK